MRGRAYLCKKGALKGKSKPDAKNDFGKVFKKRESCKD